jgi:archaellum component FlaC
LEQKRETSQAVVQLDGASHKPKKVMDCEDLRTDLVEDFEDAEETSFSSEVIKEFDNEMERCFHEFKQEIRGQLKKLMARVDKKLNELETRVKVLETKVKEGDESKLKEIKKELNRQGQHSRKDNVRMFGADEKKDEDCKKVVCDIITKKLQIKVNPTDISVAHRLPKSKRQEHRPIIAKFKDRDLKQEVVLARKKLKGSGIRIAENITRITCV